MPKTKSQQLITTPIRISLLLIAIVGVLLTNPAFGQDFGLPDSAYFGEPTYQPVGCSKKIRLSLPVYIWSDMYFDELAYAFKWGENVDCDTVRYFFIGDCDSIFAILYLNTEINIASDALFSMSSGVMGPTYGTEEIMQLDFTVNPADSVHVWCSNSSFQLTDWRFLYNWVPTRLFLDTLIVVPETLTLAQGDADASNFISISDAVYVINYIFAGGCPPYSENSADCDGNCFISISDAVYLINYIFAGGPPPQAGCVGQ